MDLMNRNIIIPLWLGLLITAAAMPTTTVWGAPPYATGRPPPQRVEHPRNQRRQGEQSASDRAAAIARSATGGKVLGVSRGGSRNKDIYRVKVLLRGGRVRSVLVDIRSGTLFEPRDGG